MDIVRKELFGALGNDADAESQRMAKYCQRMLSLLRHQLVSAPAIQRRALTRIDGLLDSLCAEVSAIDGGMMLSAALIRHVRKDPDYEQAELALQHAVKLLLSAGTSESTQRLLADISSLTREFEFESYQVTKDDELQTEEPETKEDALNASQIQALEFWLRQKFPSENQLVTGPIKNIVGGGSKKTLIVGLVNTEKLPAEIVLRVDREDGVVGSTVVDEYFLIGLMYQAGMPVPQPYAMETDKDILGAPFVLLERCEGHNIGDWTEVNEPSRGFALDLAQALAKLHQISVDKAGDRLAGTNEATSERMKREIAGFENNWRASGQPMVALELAYAWLREHIDFADGQRAIVHGDVGCHNMLGTKQHLTALLDWETAVAGNPAQDLTYAKHTVEQMMPWDEFLAEYERAGGVLPSDNEMDFYSLWRGVFRMNFQTMARSFFQSGLSTSLIHAYASQYLYRNVAYDLHETVARLYGVRLV
ncbi:MAG: phosphotransferase family protein [Halieaceae bacterium]|nr:phosphotransferase family protein [Halieaceae bacterium]